jgi:hypothetical protein
MFHNARDRGPNHWCSTIVAVLQAATMLEHQWLGSLSWASEYLLLAVLHMYRESSGSPQGADQRGCHKFMNSEFDSNSLKRLYIRQWCWQHQLHLIVKRQLETIDSITDLRYFATLAKCINVWRTPNNPKKFYNSVADLFGRPRAEAVAKRLPTRPIRGRWGNVSSAEADLMRVGSFQFPRAFYRAFCSKPGRAPNPAAAVPHFDQLDED